MFHEDWYPTEQGLFLQSLVKKVIGIEGQIIEIGCWEGKSTHQIANISYPESVICNDTWKGNVAESEYTGIVHKSEIYAFERDVFKTFKNNMDTLTKGNYSVVKKDCLEWLPTEIDPVKFCHIDASHEYDSVYKTIEYLLPRIVKGGILCGDDYLNSNIERDDLGGGVMKAVIDLLPNHTNKGNLWYWINE